MINEIFPQRCKVCGKRDKFDFHVDDETWKKVVPLPFHDRVVCLGCFDAFASQKGIDYTDAIAREVYFAGDGASFILHVAARSEAPKC